MDALAIEKEPQRSDYHVVPVRNDTGLTDFR